MEHQIVWSVMVTVFVIVTLYLSFRLLSFGLPFSELPLIMREYKKRRGETEAAKQAKPPCVVVRAKSPWYNLYQFLVPVFGNGLIGAVVLNWIPESDHAIFLFLVLFIECIVFFEWESRRAAWYISDFREFMRLTEPEVTVLRGFMQEKKADGFKLPHGCACLEVRYIIETSRSMVLDGGHFFMSDRDQKKYPPARVAGQASILMFCLMKERLNSKVIGQVLGYQTPS